MEKWEICILTPLFVKNKDEVYWEAYQSTSQGIIPIAKSQTLSSLSYRDKLGGREQTNLLLLAELGAQGWEPTGTDQNGHVRVIKRRAS
jgi:hypothetical protein